MTLEQKSLLAKVLMVAGLIAGVAGSILEIGTVEKIGFLGVAAGFILLLAWQRCPHCGKFLGRNPGEYCKNCGRNIQYDKK